MEAYLEKQYGKELIAVITMQADGIGSTMGGAIAEYFDNLQDFLKAEPNEFKKIARKGGKQALKDDVIQRVVAVKAGVVLGKSVSETWVFVLTKTFLRDQIDMLNSMDFDSVDINPFLIKALDLKTARDIILFNMYQWVTRSVVTSWGMLVEKLVKYSGCESEKPKIAGKGVQPDLKKIIGKKTYYLQIKSGPNTMNVGMVESLNEVIKTLEKKGHIGLLGMTYGKRSHISNQISGNLNGFEEKTKIGRELWDFISGSKNYHRKVIEAIDSATSHLLEESFVALIDKKVDEFVKCWEIKFKGKTAIEILEEYL